MKIPQKKYLVPGLILLSLLSILFALLFARGMFLEKGPEGGVTPLPKPEMKIDFSVLESPVLEGLKPFEKIPPFEEEVGRENPFLPY